MLILFGKHGQVAREIITEAARRELRIQSYSSQEADFQNPEAIENLLRGLPAESVVINAAAYTQVDQAETDTQLARQLNALTPELLAKVCQERGCRLIHVSTDYVFSGEKRGAYLESDAVHPLGVYGATKLEGEQRILKSLQQALILRTSWVFSPYGRNFVKTMLRLGAERRELSVVADQTGGPTSAASIARTCLTLAQAAPDLDDDSPNWGLYHYCGAPSTTWHGFAEEIFHQAGMNVRVTAIPATDYPTPAQRPSNSLLDCGRIFRNFGIRQPDWRIDLRETLTQL